MQVNRSLRVIAPTVSADVLGVLAGAEASFTPPEIHRLLGEHSVDGVRRALHGLVEQGIVRPARSGNAVRYELNRQHLAAPSVLALARLRDVLIERLQRRIEGWATQCTSAALFGSAATASMRPDSDIDLFVVRPNAVTVDDRVWRRQIDSLEAKVAAWTGNDVRTLEYDEDEVAAGVRAGDRVLADIRDRGVLLAGSRERWGAGHER